MKYEEIVEIARAQSIDPHPGPDFSTLMAAREGGRSARRRRGWILAVTAVAAVAVVVVLGIGGMQALLESPASDPVEAVWSPGPPDPAGVVTPPPRLEVPQEPESTTATEEPEVANETEEDAEARDEDGSEAGSADGSDSDGGGGDRSRGRARASAEQMYAEAEAKMVQQDWAGARRALRRLTRTYPKHATHGDALADLARIERRLGRRQAAYCSYRRLLREHPSHPLAGSAATASRELMDEGGIVDRCR